MDRDRRERLEADRDFLLRSLDDLDVELAAGDIAEADHRVLTVEYTARAARVIRQLARDDAIDTDRGDEPTLPPGRARAPGTRIRPVAWVMIVVAVAAVGGLLLARFSGSRGTGDSITGDIRTTTRDLLFDAQQAFNAGDPDEAFALYDQVLAIQPTSVEALAYRGWLTARTADPADAVADLDEAIAIDPDYPDARVFRAVVALDLGDTEAAAEHLAAFDALDPPAFARQLVDDALVRERIARARVEEVLLVDDPPPFSRSGLTVADLSAAAEALASEGELLRAVQLFDTVLEEDPDNVEALTYRGWLIARAGDPQLLESGIALLDRALTLDPVYPPALVFRAFALNEAGDRAAARSDLAAFDALADRPTDLTALVEEFGLRETLEE